jgi:hypothetical protein
MALDFLPFKDGQVLKSDDLNELVESIQNGTIFLNTTYISSQLNTSSTRLTGLEARVTYLESLQAFLSIKEQKVLTAGQPFVGLAHAPILDSEIVAIGGQVLAKTDVPIGFVGDYTISGSTLTFNTELASQIEAGETLVIHYRYEV